MRILYANHTARVSGAERSLLDLLGGLPSEIVPEVACPAGPMADKVREIGVRVTQIPGTDASLRLHPWHSARGVVELARMGIALRRAARRASADLIHANSVRAGVAAAIATAMGGPRVIVHVRDCLPATRTAAVVRNLVSRRATMVIANSRYTARRFVPDGLVPVQTVYNPVSLRRFSPTASSRSAARAMLGIDPGDPLLGVIGQITPWKAQDDAIRILSRIRPTWPNVQLLIVGEAKFTARATRYDNGSHLRAIHRMVEELELERNVHFLGEREDIPEILRALDLLLLPSWEEPFGRTVIEAMAMEVPVVATARGGPAEIISPGDDGLILEPRQPERWSKAITELLRDEDWRQAMGRAGRRKVLTTFSLERHVEGVINAYRAVLNGAAH